MRKKEIEKIPYLGLKKINRKKDVKYIGVTAVKIVGNKKHLFLEVSKTRKNPKWYLWCESSLRKRSFGIIFQKQSSGNGRKWRKMVDTGIIYGEKKLLHGSRWKKKMSSRARRIWKE